MNIVEFKSFLEKPIVFCLVDTTPSITDPWIKELVKNQTDYTIQNLYNKGYTIIQGTDEDELLRHAVSSFKHACVFSVGTEFTNGEACLDALVEACTDDYLIKGHILDRGDAYYELHQQCYLINLEKYKNFNCPIIGKQELGEKHTCVRPYRSMTNIHDDYTPTYIRKGTFVQDYNHKCHGWNIIQVALEQTDGIYAFTDNIRNNKKHLYPESPKDFYKHVSYVYTKERYCANEFVHTEHTEWSNKDILNLRQVIAPASGEWYKSMLDTSEPCTVVLYDYNAQSLQYWKSNIEKLPNVTYKFVHWDLLGEDLNILDYLDSNLFEDTLINLSNIFCYEGTTTLASTRYRLEKENKLVNYFKQHAPNCWINFAARASSGFINTNEYIQRACNMPTYTIEQLKKPTWHYSDWP